ncbi:histidine phosphatase family protein [Thermopolyspora sp. NPDC052614]|uniref:histidine phosphatase family protein n=1 Tax=Thermopolyspora sp. NPDC052614 TaxID=3155682 RepID=UPI00342DDBBD
MAELILLRHGETEWSRDHRHTGRTDVPLTGRGEQQARLLAPEFAGHRFALVLVSPALRARRTAELAGLTAGNGAAAPEPDPDLWEWDYGGYEGVTTARIREDRPGWYLWRDGVIPGGPEHPGETIDQVGARVDRVIARVRPVLADANAEADPDTDDGGGGNGGDVAVVAHGHLLRALTARWLGLPPRDGRLFRLDTGTISALGFEHGEPVILRWNAPVRSP